MWNWVHDFLGTDEALILQFRRMVSSHEDAERTNHYPTGMLIVGARV